MLCPECNHQLAPIALPVKTGKVELDYCNRCGGVWSDRGEVNFLEEKDLSPLIHVLPKRVTHAAYITHRCPKDKSTLEQFRGESVPVDLHLYRCITCAGIWFPEKSLFEFKKAQRAKLSYYKTWKIPLHSMYAILLPVLLFVLLTGGLISSLIGVRQGTDIRTRATLPLSRPLALSPVAGQILISFTSQTPSVARIRYWKTLDEVKELSVSATAQTTHTIHLKNLEPGATYSYQLVLTDPTLYESPVYVIEVTDK